MDGEVVRLWFRLAADGLGRARTAIDMLNVFPVPDSDTGTNLHRTISSAADAVAGLPAQASAAEIWQAAATAALLGACGNSGIIVSQLLRGLADTCGPASPCDGAVMASALASAAALARAAVLRPVEGTVLTVADAAADAAARATGLPEVSRAAALGARQALAGTTRQLGVLAASGVVDAGGAGLCVLLDALNAAISGTHLRACEVPAPAHARRSLRADQAGPAGATPEYEVTFVIEAAEPAIAGLRVQLGRFGNSVVVSGREPLWHVHVHVADAGAVIEASLAVGRPSKITITYLNAAPSVTVASGPASVGGVVATPPPVTVASGPASVGGVAPPDGLLVITDGTGLRGMLTAAGATVVAGDAQSCQAELDVIAAAGARATLITLAGSPARRWPAGWPVIEVDSPVQSLAAVAVHDARNDRSADLAAMRRAVAGVRSASLAAAEPGAAQERFTGWIAGRQVAAGGDQVSVAVRLADFLRADGPEMITLLTGQDADPGLSAAVAARFAAAAPAVEIVCYDGGMTSAVLVIGAE